MILQQINWGWETYVCVCFRDPFLLPQRASFCQPWCTLCVSMVAMCVTGLCVRAVEALSPLQGVSFHSLTSSSCCCCPVGHRGTQSPDWATLAWPCSIPPTTLITSQMVIDEASLAALTPLKDSQTYIRGATDRSELLPSKAGLHRELEARFTNYSCSSTLLPCASPAPSRQLFSHRQRCAQTGLPTNPGQTVQAC